MSGFSTSLANAVINSSLRGLPFPTIRTTYYALFTSDPTDSFTAGNEVSATWYARVPTGAFAAPVSGSTYNATQAQFGVVTGVNVTVTHVGIVEGSNATDVTSTLLYSHQLTAPKTLTVSDRYVVETDAGTGDFVLSLL